MVTAGTKPTFKDGLQSIIKLQRSFIPGYDQNLLVYFSPKVYLFLNAHYTFIESQANFTITFYGLVF